MIHRASLPRPRHRCVSFSFSISRLCTKNKLAILSCVLKQRFQTTFAYVQATTSTHSCTPQCSFSREKEPKKVGKKGSSIIAREHRPKVEQRPSCSLPPTCPKWFVWMRKRGSGLVKQCFQVFLMPHFKTPLRQQLFHEGQCLLHKLHVKEHKADRQNKAQIFFSNNNVFYVT